MRATSRSCKTVAMLRELLLPPSLHREPPRGTRGPPPTSAARPNENGPSRAHFHSMTARRRTGVPPARGSKKRKAPRGGFPPTSTRRSERHRRRGRGLEHPTHRGRAFYGRLPRGANHFSGGLERSGGGCIAR